jgi:tetratricopeptide (TPR) repeat protein
MATSRHGPNGDLDRLFRRLQQAPTASEARAISDQIWERWMQHPDPSVRTLMRRGVKAMEREDYEEAHTIFDAVVAQDPDYAEGWNKRATVRYLRGDYAGAVRDVKETLRREPRHFGALSGLGSIYLIIANVQGALDAFEQVLALNPRLDSVRKQVRELRRALDE